MSNHRSTALSYCE